MPVPLATLGQTEKRKRDLLLEEQCFVSGIRLHVLLERFILHECVIRPEKQHVTGERQIQYTFEGYDVRKHHQCAGFLVNVLVRPLPLFPDPLLIEKQLEIVVG